MAKMTKINLLVQNKWKFINCTFLNKTKILLEKKENNPENTKRILQAFVFFLEAEQSLSKEEIIFVSQSISLLSVLVFSHFE